MDIGVSIIKVFLGFVTPLIFVFADIAAFSHGGGLNAQGCHNNRKAGDYHCHRGEKSSSSQSAGELQRTGNEEYFNDRLAREMRGRREVRINYLVPDSSINGYVIIDIETADMVIEGGLDKRSSLDSVQQALFASTITGKRPAVAIYDTDGVWGEIEHRVYTAAKAVGVKFYWINGSTFQKN